MQLHAARLCLDCQEVHAEARCPRCASESFVPLSRWIPPQERRTRTRPEDAEQAETYRQLLTDEPAQKTRSKWPRRAAFVIAGLSIGGWLWRRSPGSRQ